MTVSDFSHPAKQGESLPDSPTERIDARIDRYVAAGFASLTTILAYDLLGQWFAWGFMIGQFLLAVLLGIYAFGVERGQRG